MFDRTWEHELEDKLRILTGAAKYDVACTSSGVSRAGRREAGNASMGDMPQLCRNGRCISLLKILMSSALYDCSYCVNRRSNDTPRQPLSRGTGGADYTVLQAQLYEACSSAPV